MDRRLRAVELLLQNKSAEAEAEFDVEVDDFNAFLKAGAGIYWGRAKARLDQAKYDGCIEDSKKAIELDGSVWNPYLYMGTAYFHQKLYVEARSVLLMGVDLAPNNRSDFDNVISKLDEALVAGNAVSELAEPIDPVDPEHAELPEQEGVVVLPVEEVDVAVLPEEDVVVAVAVLPEEEVAVAVLPEEEVPEEEVAVDVLPEQEVAVAVLPEQEVVVAVLPDAEVVVDPNQFVPLYLKTLTPSDINKTLVIYSDVGQVMFDEAMDRGVFDAHTNTFPIHLINGAGGETIETVMNLANNRCRVNWKAFLALNPELIVGQQVAFSKQWVQVLGVATLVLMVVPV